ncbi:hypothetical protein EYF80_051356 [Liparis tanakae]|uniref:Uncharacterized protein n=1 Tax=Liparis tanakae TaxID=230148 RepID=A0A4Z2FBE5_9TELE|nr:hypothetical protein EYF80_051356 [Liparis tanakae]
MTPWRQSGSATTCFAENPWDETKPPEMLDFPFVSLQVFVTRSPRCARRARHAALATPCRDSLQRA